MIASCDHHRTDPPAVPTAGLQLASKCRTSSRA
jgi:hypothetical protein